MCGIRLQVSKMYETSVVQKVGHRPETIFYNY